MSEAIIMARSYSSALWMFPIGSLAEQSMFLRRQGVLEIRNLQVHATHSKVCSKYEIYINFEVDFEGDRQVLDSGNARVSEGEIVFHDEVNAMQFAGPPDLPVHSTLKATLKEDWEDQTHNPCKAAFAFVAGDKSVAATEAVILAPTLNGHEWSDVCLKLSRNSSAYDSVSFQARWLDYRSLRREWTGSEDLSHDAASSGMHGALRHKNQPEALYDCIDLSSLLAME